jgi:ribosomal 30S subunit maturation factor RimM
LEDTGGVPVLRVSGSQGEILIPIAQEICETVDPERRVIRVRLPEGLRHLNQEPGRGIAYRWPER